MFYGNDRPSRWLRAPMGYRGISARSASQMSSERTPRLAEPIRRSRIVRCDVGAARGAGASRFENQLPVTSEVSSPSMEAANQCDEGDKGVGCRARGFSAWAGQTSDYVSPPFHSGCSIEHKRVGYRTEGVRSLDWSD